jgi:hypothetical protein
MLLWYGGGKGKASISTVQVPEKPRLRTEMLPASRAVTLQIFSTIFVICVTADARCFALRRFQIDTKALPRRRRSIV